MLFHFVPQVVLLGLLRATVLTAEQGLDGGCVLCQKTREMRAKDRISAILKAILEEVPILAPAHNFKRQKEPLTQHAALAAMFPSMKQDNDGFENRKVIAMSQPGKLYTCGVFLLRIFAVGFIAMCFSSYVVI